MNILLMYATYSGSTTAASQIAEQVLQAKGHQVTVKQVQETQPTDFVAADFVLLASPSWDYHGEEGMPHEDYLEAFKTFAGQTFPTKKFAVLGLGDSNFTKFCGAADHLENWVKELQGDLFVPSLRLDQYYFNETENGEKVKLWAAQLGDALV
ncbi:MAG: flavodoxin [Patescibacteria group bacterium]|nr:flavodoxin [Patescibacteria group bacterium]